MWRVVAQSYAKSCVPSIIQLKDQDTPSLNGWETFFELGLNTCNYVWLIIIDSFPQPKKKKRRVIGSQEQLIKLIVCQSPISLRLRTNFPDKCNG